MKTFQAIEKLGGRRRIAEIVTRAGHPVSEDAVRMWCARGRIPGAGMRAMIAYAERRGIRLAARDFVACEKRRKRKTKECV